MKNAFMALAIFSACAASAQSDTKVPVTTPATKPTATAIPTASVPVAPAPVASTAKSDNIRPEDFLPVLGTYKTATSTPVTIVVDESNVGIVWVEGLQQGRFKAMLRQSPATYKIPAQKSESGKSVSEGTLVYNPDTREVKIAFGAYNDENPVAVFEKSKVKTIVATKVEAAVAQ